MQEITVKAVCGSCGGTGLYQGMCEKDGAFVVCTRCRGTGCATITYKPFEGRKEQPKCNRVYRSSCGYVITDKDITNNNGEFLPFSTSGVSYEEWKNGKEPVEIRFLGCPMLVDQGACHNRSGFKEECNKLNGGWISLIAACKNQCNKSECWERFDKAKVK